MLWDWIQYIKGTTSTPPPPSFQSTLLPILQHLSKMYFSIIIHCGYSVAWKFPHVSKVLPQTTHCCPHPLLLCKLIWMTDQIWRRSMSLFKGGRPVTYGTMFLNGSVAALVSVFCYFAADGWVSQICPVVSLQLTQKDTHIHTHIHSKCFHP